MRGDDAVPGRLRSWINLRTGVSALPLKPMPAELNPSPLRALKPRKELTKDDISALLEEIKAALNGAVALDYFERMEHNHRVRFAWWPGQTRDGRKWQTAERLANLMPGQTPQEARDLFPWKGAPDNRVRLVDTVIREHNSFQQIALLRKQQTVGPRGLSPDEDPQAKAALWGQVDDYYGDFTKREWRRTSARWADIAKEYGCGVLFVGWKTQAEAIERTIDAAKLQEAIEAAAVDVAMQQALALHEAAGGTPEDFPGLSAEEEFMVSNDAAAKLADLMLDDEQRAVLAAKLMELDPEMPKDEAMRTAAKLKWGEEVTYYAVTITQQHPIYRALTYGVDVLFPPTVESLKDSPWIVMTEWVSEPELKARVLSPHEPYEQTAVDAVLEHPGKALDLGTLLNGCSSNAWLLSGGSVRNGLDSTALEDANQHHYQLLHVFYRASAIGNAPALYHTVISGHCPDEPLFHECCDEKAGRYAFYETLSQIEAPYLLAAEGYGEQSATDQNEVKIQRDSRGADASLRIKPPLKVPMQQAGGRVDWRPGVQFPTRQTAGMGIEVMSPGTDSRGSQEVELTTLDSFNDYWKRGAKVDADVKMAFRQVVVSHFLTDVAAAREHAFKLIQQYSPDEIRASFAGGLPVNLNATRKDIQGMVAYELDFDVTTLDNEIMGKRMDAVSKLLSVDTGNDLQRNTLLRALTAGILPSWYKTLVADPQARQMEEITDEQQQNANILAGVQFDEEASYREGLNYAARLKTMQRIYGTQVDKDGKPGPLMPNGANGQMSRAQRLFSEDPDVQGRVLNRFAFHARQLQQQRNAQIGRQQVEAVTA